MTLICKILCKESAEIYSCDNASFFELTSKQVSNFVKMKTYLQMYHGCK